MRIAVTICIRDLQSPLLTLKTFSSLAFFFIGRLQLTFTSEDVCCRIQNVRSLKSGFLQHALFCQLSVHFIDRESGKG